MADRLISADALKSRFEYYRTHSASQDFEYAYMIAERETANAPTVDAIPISVIKREINGIAAADQCDQAGRYDFELRNALNVVLKWYKSPRYQEAQR